MKRQAPRPLRSSHENVTASNSLAQEIRGLSREIAASGALGTADPQILPSRRQMMRQHKYDRFTNYRDNFSLEFMSLLVRQLLITVVNFYFFIA